MTLQRVGWRALVSWLCHAALLGVIGLAAVAGPQIADAAWDRGVHVSPQQAALHNALQARHIVNHHHLLAAAAASGATDELAPPADPLLRNGQSLTTFGSPFSELLPASWQVCSSTLACLPAERTSKFVASGAYPPPPTPPPQTSLAIP